jgi:hypothetical protein
LTLALYASGMNIQPEGRVKEIEIRLRVPVGMLKALFLSALVVLPATELASESVTLSTYYPAPSGVYNTMITTGRTLLGTSGGSVAIGPAVAATETAHSSIKLDVNGRIRTNNGLWLDIVGDGGDIFIGRKAVSGGNGIGFWTAGANMDTLDIAQDGTVNVYRTLRVAGSLAMAPRSAPSPAQDGQLYYDHAAKKFMGRANGAWVPLGAAPASAAGSACGADKKGVLMFPAGPGVGTAPACCYVSHYDTWTTSAITCKSHY